MLTRDVSKQMMRRMVLAAFALFPPGVAAGQAGPQVRADSVRPYLVFAPARESWFVVASRGKRMLLDIGRVDLEVRRDSAVAQAYREAVAAASPVPVGTTFTLRAPWGAERVRTSAIDTWNGRIVLVLSGSAAMDSAAQAKTTVVAAAFRETAAPAVVPPVAAAADSAACVRAPISDELTARVKAVRDSIERVLRAEGPPPYERLARRVTAASSQAVGCFGPARVALAVSLRAGATEWSRERVVMIDTLGNAQAVAVEDLRFKVHDLLHAVDADGDGVDDLAVVGRTHLAGGTTLLRYDVRKKRLVRLAAGFVWEAI